MERLRSIPRPVVLVFRIGQLGDTVVAVPAIHALREWLPTASLALLCDRQVGRPYVLASDLFGGTDFFDDYLDYPYLAEGGGAVRKILAMGRLLLELRRRRFDAVIYLAPSTRPPMAVRRDRIFFRMAGIPRFLGGTGFVPLPPMRSGLPLEPAPFEADLILRRIALDGIPVPAPGTGNMELRSTSAEERAVDDWAAGLPGDGGRRWIGVGPGSKMPAKVWPEGRFAEVVAGLIARYDVWPVVFGGSEDAALGNRLVSAWGRGWVAAGALGIRQSLAALRRCRLYVGNDTGTMHLAVAAGTRCVAIFSARDRPGLWEPYGSGHRVLRRKIECEGCELMECIEKGNACTLAIGVDEVVSACCSMLDG